MLEKLALLKIAFCRAPAFSSTSSACLRELTSPAPSVTPTRVLVTSFPLAMVLSPITCTALSVPNWRLVRSVTPQFNTTTAMGGLPSIFLGFPPTARAVGLRRGGYKSCRRWLRRGRYNGVAGAFAATYFAVHARSTRGAYVIAEALAVP